MNGTDLLWIQGDQRVRVRVFEGGRVCALSETILICCNACKAHFLRAAADKGISELGSVRAFMRFPLLKKTEVVLDASIDRTNISYLII